MDEDPWMASLLGDDVGGALAGLLDGWSDSELLPSLSLTSELSAPSLAAAVAPQASRESAVEKERRAVTKRSGDSNVTRKREREERERLELEAYGLEMQLAATLRHRQARAGGEKQGGGGRSSSSSSSSSSAEMWATVARNQRQAKQRAELQNAALRELLAEQLRLAKSMERMASRRPSRATLLRAFGSADLAPRKRLRSTASAADDRAFERLFQCVDRGYGELDSALAGDGGGGSGGEREQFLYSATIPFGRKAAMDAAWAFLSRDQQGVPGGEYRVLARSASTIACESVRAVEEPGDAGDACGGGSGGDGDPRVIRLRCAMRKAEERDRTVLVWQSATEPSSDSRSGSPMEQSGWLVLSDASASPSTGGAATRIQMCVRQPGRADARQAPGRGASTPGGCAMDPLTELLFRDAGRNVGAWYQYVENILMDPRDK